LVQTKLKGVGIDVEVKHVLWVKARPDYEPLFSILNGLCPDEERRYWIDHRETEGNICDIDVT